MRKFQVGDKVRILDVSKILCGREHYFDGMETEVVDLFINEFPKLRNKQGVTGVTIAEWEYEAIHLITEKERISALEKEVAELKKVVEEIQLHNPKQVDLPQWSEPVVSTTSLRETLLDMAGKVLDRQLRESVLPQSNNQKRAAIIKKAKQFVEKHTRPNSIVTEWKEHGGIRIDTEGFVGIPFFTVKERTVTIVLKGVESGRILRKTVACCHPHDCFNEHIGKAIALGRALGLDVSEFEQAVQPDEVVVGMVVNAISASTGKTMFANEKVTRLHNGKYPGFQIGFASKFKITNDTNAQY